MNNNSVLIAVVAILAGAIIVAGAAFYFLGAGRVPGSPSSPGNGGVACTMEARQCPDGSYVGRTGPNCEFAPCPGGVDIKVQY